MCTSKLEMYLGTCLILSSTFCCLIYQIHLDLVLTIDVRGQRICTRWVLHVFIVIDHPNELAVLLFFLWEDYCLNLLDIFLLRCYSLSDQDKAEVFNLTFNPDILDGVDLHS